jgi:hypothetical protein
MPGREIVAESRLMTIGTSRETPYLSYPNQRLYDRLGYRKCGERAPPWAAGSDFRLFEYEKLP